MRTDEETTRKNGLAVSGPASSEAHKCHRWGDARRIGLGREVARWRGRELEARAKPGTRISRDTRAMSRPTDEARALAAIEQHGALLVYPIHNQREPPSLWRALHPRSEMHWAWDADADPRVAALWRLRERLARARDVVYGKWYRGRAVFFAKPLFEAMLAVLQPDLCDCSMEAREILALLEDDSPQSSKTLRAAAGLKGKLGERTWTRAMQELWSRLLVVGTGEVDDGAFPSLEVGATRWIFEEQWEAARAGPNAQHELLLATTLAPGSAFEKHWRKLLASKREP